MAVARGRHAPPPEVRHRVQRDRLLQAAALEFAKRGYRGASSDTVSKRAGMSKATFYEHFANKEECMLALYDHGVELLTTAMATAVSDAPRGDAHARIRAGTRAFLDALADNPPAAQTLLVEIIGAGPRAAQRRDEVLQRFAAVLIAENAAAARRGLSRRFASEHDAFAVVGASVELISRQLRLGVPTEVTELAPVIDRLIFGLLSDDAQA